MKPKILISFILLLSGCALLGRRAVLHRQPAAEYQDDNLPKISADQKLSSDKIRSLLKEEKIDSVEELLAYLGEKFPDYLRFHTLMYNSLSIQGSSFDEPRALVFGPEARFVMTFNGSDSQIGGHSIEMMDFSEEKKSFEFREVTFKSKGFNREELNLKPSEIEFENRHYLVSKPNPGKCVQCHGETGNPIWATYFLWPGAYGSDDDNLTMSFDRSSWNGNNGEFLSKSNRPQSQGRLMVLKKGLKDSELNGLIRFVQHKDGHPRYKWLPTQFYESSLLSFANGNKFDQVDASELAAQQREQFHTNFAWPSRPNLYFQMALMDLNQERILKVLKEKDLKEAFRSDIWKEFVRKDQNGAPMGSAYVEKMSLLIHEGLSRFPSKKGWPSLGEIQRLLESNIYDEIMMQIEKLHLHESSLGLGENSLRYRPVTYYHEVRFGMAGLGEPVSFYSKLLKRSSVTDLDKIAFHLETDDLASLTLLSLLLKDQGIDIQKYSMNLRQQGVSFHSGGLNRVRSYLGVD